MSKSQNGYRDDAMAPLRFCLKVLGRWPEDQTPLQRYTGYFNVPVWSMLYLPFMIWYIVFDGPKDGLVAMFQGVCDTLAISTFIVRGSLLFYYANDIFKLSELATKGCKPFEENHKAVLIKPSRVVWLPTMVLLVQILMSAFLSATILWDEVEERKASVPLSKTALRTDFVFYPMMVIYFISHIPNWLNTLTSDALIISLSTAIREKAETMKNMLRDFVKIKVHSQQDDELNKIIRYHNIIARIRSETERIMSFAMLLQIMFLVLSLGTPAIRLLQARDTMSTGDLGFTVCYVIWAISQLIVYCEVCDAATKSCSSLMSASYFSYHPDMSVAAGRKLVLIMARAQRPMDITGRNLIKINRKTLLKISRRSYSLYSAVLNMK